MSTTQRQIEAAYFAVKGAIQRYNDEYPFGAGFGAATRNYEARVREFNKLAQEEMGRTGQVSSLVAETRQYQRDNGFWTHELDAIIEEHTKCR